jgi:hypothetical protein
MAIQTSEITFQGQELGFLQGAKSRSIVDKAGIKKTADEILASLHKLDYTTPEWRKGFKRGFNS